MKEFGEDFRMTDWFDLQEILSWTKTEKLNSENN